MSKNSLEIPTIPGCDSAELQAWLFESLSFEDLEKKLQAPDYCYRAEFIGQELEIIKTPNMYEKNLKGIVVNETKNSFQVLVKTLQGLAVKTVLKKHRVFKIGECFINGDWVLKRPEERVKAKLNNYKIKAFNKALALNGFNALRTGG